MGTFKISISNLHWINGSLDYPSDLCLHGDAVAYIGKKKVSFKGATVSATALYLLKSITENHYPSNDGEEVQMLPCCGFNMYPDSDLQNVSIMGCPNGKDLHSKYIYLVGTIQGLLANLDTICLQCEMCQFK